MEIVTRQGHPDFLDLPWETPLDQWETPRLAKMAHGISRHIVRFVRYDDRVYALKATEQSEADREFRILRGLHDDHLPVVEPVGVVHDAPEAGKAVLITRYLDFSMPYWYVLGRADGHWADRLMDAGVVLLVRLHLEGVFWGDCSLSNILWRRDAGAMMAYLVDAETTEHRSTISDQMREYDIEIATENVVGGLLDLQAAGRVDTSVDPWEIAAVLQARYEELWSELTRVDSFGVDERWRIEDRVRRINDLGFDVEELSISKDGSSLQMRPLLVDEGHHARELRRRTGLEVQENQARRLLADIAGHRAWLEAQKGRSMAQAMATAHWLGTVYQPMIEMVPAELRGHLEDAELFHEFLEHRYLLSQRRNEGVTSAVAMEDYLEHVLRHRKPERQIDDAGPDPTAS